MSSMEFLRRAYGLSDSGAYSRGSEIRAVMGREGFSLHQLSQLGGKQLAQQLKDRIAATQRGASPQ